MARNLYASDGIEIYKVTPDGILTLFASGLSGVMGLAVDAAGNIHEADTGSGNVYKFTPQGVQTTFASGLEMFDFGGTVPSMVFDGQGNLFVPSSSLYEDCPGCATYHGAIYKISPQGAVSTVDLPSGYRAGAAVGLDSSGNLFVTAFYSNYFRPFSNTPRKEETQ
jgi:hypothetical protein